MSFVLNAISYLPKFAREYIMPDMLIPQISNNPSKVQLVRLSHIYFEHPDLKQLGNFAKDFGLVVEKWIGDNIYLSGYGKDPYVYVASKSKDGKAHFGGAAFVAASRV